MSRIPDYTQNVSLRMSQVMDEIGVNEKIVMKRRKLVLLNESLYTLTQHDRDRAVYLFGSQIEGTTTPGLSSDEDCLITGNKYNVIQDWSEWQHGKQNLLMIQDENVSPGYCMLQVLRDDAPLPAVIEVGEHLYRGSMGKILLKNTFFNSCMGDGLSRHGPALSRQDIPGSRDYDLVHSFPCQSYPVQASQWSDQHRAGRWPSYDMKRYCSSAGCFIVPVGNKGSVNEKLEWRISTSLAERYLMFSLNMTQIRCYVLMKMMLKTFITPRFPESISSYMCKTVLLHCVSNTRSDEWKESTLLTCLHFCLVTLYNCVINEYCPHFIIQENNLMLRRFSPDAKPSILENLLYVIRSNGRALLEIECDGFSSKLQLLLSGLVGLPAQFVPTLIAGQIVKSTAVLTNICCRGLLREVNKLPSRQAAQLLSSILSNLSENYHTRMDRIASCLVTQHLCQTMGSVLASSTISRRSNLTCQALNLMSLGLNSDVASGKLKLASIFFCMGDVERAEFVLKNIEECYDLSVVEPVCKCYDFQQAARRDKFNSLCFESNQEHSLLKRITASCVRFLRSEVNCCPNELRYEMFRSTQEDLLYRDEYDDWMEMAVVDSLPYLYFLQCMTYSHVGRQGKKSKALSNLVRTIIDEPNLGHRETALNLLGQCMEMENLKDNALTCYLLSLKVRGRNNAAKFLICRLLSRMIHGH